MCEAEQRTDGISWLPGELAGAIESLAEDLMTKGGSNPQAQPFSVPRRWPTSYMAVCSSAVGGLERPRCGGMELSDVPGHVCASPCIGALVPARWLLHLGTWSLLWPFKQLSRSAAVTSLFLGRSMTWTDGKP